MQTLKDKVLLISIKQRNCKIMTEYLTMYSTESCWKRCFKSKGGYTETLNIKYYDLII